MLKDSNSRTFILKVRRVRIVHYIICACKYVLNHNFVLKVPFNSFLNYRNSSLSHTHTLSGGT